MKSLPATSVGNLIRMLCWLFIQMVLSIWTQLGGSHVKLYPLKTFIGPRAIYRNATRKIHKPSENRIGSKILQNPGKIPSKFTNPAKTEMVRKSFKILQKFLQNSRTLRKQKWLENPSKSCKNSWIFRSRF